MCPDQASNWWPFAFWDDAQHPEPCQSGHNPEIFNSQTCSHLSSSNLIRIWIYLPWPWFPLHSNFCTWVSAQKAATPWICLSVSPVLRATVPPVLSCLMDPKGVLDSQPVQLFALVGTVWHLPGSLHAELETRNVNNPVILSWVFFQLTSWVCCQSQEVRGSKVK